MKSVVKTVLKPRRFEIYRDLKRHWRWRFKAGNGRIIAVSSEGYRGLAKCRETIDWILREQSTIARIEILR